MLAAAAAPAQPVDITANTEIATAGYFQLRWRSDDAVVVQEARSDAFAEPRVIYEGADNARVVSGKPDGDWYYRARTRGSGTSFGDSIRVTVRHHPVERAFGFFAVGAVVFLATLGLIAWGARTES